MAKGKVHKSREVDVEHGGDGFGAVAAECRQKHRPMLPLALTEDWRLVTCAKCLRRRPRRTLLARLMDWYRGGRR